MMVLHYHAIQGTTCVLLSNEIIGGNNIQMQNKPICCKNPNREE